jgi:hypothetical protein
MVFGILILLEQEERGVGWLYAEEEKRKEREKKQDVSLQPVWTQELRNFVMETSGPCVNSECITTILVD